MRAFVAALVAVSVFGVANCRPDGAPVEACSTLTPQHEVAPLPCNGCGFNLTVRPVPQEPGNGVDPSLTYRCGENHTGVIFYR